MKTHFAEKCFTVMFFLSFCLVPFATNAAEKVITLRFATFTAATTITGKSLQAWANEIEKRTNGRVKVNVYPGATIMTMQQTYDGVVTKVADIGYGTFAYHPGRFPLMEVIDLPLGYIRGDVPTKLVNRFYKKFKPKELDDVKVLFLGASGPAALHAKKPVSKLEDLAGMKIRTSGPGTKLMKALGATPVGLPITDAYDALSKGVVQGMLVDWGGFYNWNFGGLVSNHIVLDGSISYSAAFYTVMNKDKWNSLPPDIREIIDNVDEEWIDAMAKTWAAYDAEGRTNLKKMGNKFITLSKEEKARWVAKVAPIINDYLKDTKAKGLPGDEVLKFCQDYLKANDK